MGTEIERRFLVNTDVLLPLSHDVVSQSEEITQGYLSLDCNRIVRIRIIRTNTLSESAVVTIKGLKAGVTCKEFEYSIPVMDARYMLDHMTVGSLVQKKRYYIPTRTHVWAIDLFRDLNFGLVIAEIELRHEDDEFEKPPWLGAEITTSAKWFNSSLAKSPYTDWSAEKRDSIK